MKLPGLRHRHGKRCSGIWVTRICERRWTSASMYRPAPVGEFGADGEEEGRCPEATNAPPASNVPTPCAQVGTEPASDEVAEHVNHVEPTPGAGIDAVDSGLVGNVTALYA